MEDQEQDRDELIRELGRLIDKITAFDVAEETDEDHGAVLSWLVMVESQSFQDAQSDGTTITNIRSDGQTYTTTLGLLAAGQKFV